MRSLLVSAWLLGTVASAQPRILHFTRTSGYDHGTRAVSFALFQSIAQELGAAVDDDATGDSFSDPVTLAEYHVIIFGNTSGNAILSAQQRANFEEWVANGGHVMGIHAASDTYRHSTANGGNTGTWDFYAELIGASVQESPNHVAGTPEYAMELIGAHASTVNLPDPWVKNEEYYYWEGGYYGPDNVEVLRVEQTVGPNGQVNSYDAPRPMSWYRMLPNGSRVFYTALGHAAENYTSDALFRAHIRDALGWLMEGSMGMNERTDGQLRILPNPTCGPIRIDGLSGPNAVIEVFDGMGHLLHQSQLAGNSGMDMGFLDTGVYCIRIDGARAARVVIAK
ncbi:MAG: ThuA domain-containing protein [Flavobacteriales bacterium]|nr:MAG: ThuA domain-containing protein [Flavobacteriales bacterium]